MYCPSLVQPAPVSRDFHFLGPLKFSSKKMLLIWLTDESLGGHILNWQLCTVYKYCTGLLLERSGKENTRYEAGEINKNFLPHQVSWLNCHGSFQRALVMKSVWTARNWAAVNREPCLPYTLSCYRCWDHYILILKFIPYFRWTKVSLAFTSPPGHGTDTDDMVSSILNVTELP